MHFATGDIYPAQFQFQQSRLTIEERLGLSGLTFQLCDDDP